MENSFLSIATVGQGPKVKHQCFDCTFLLLPCIRDRRDPTSILISSSNYLVVAWLGSESSACPMIFYSASNQRHFFVAISSAFFCALVTKLLLQYTQSPSINPSSRPPLKPCSVCHPPFYSSCHFLSASQNSEQSCYYQSPPSSPQWHWPQPSSTQILMLNPALATTSPYTPGMPPLTTTPHLRVATHLRKPTRKPSPSSMMTGNSPSARYLISLPQSSSCAAMPSPKAAAAGSRPKVEDQEAEAPVGASHRQAEAGGRNMMGSRRTTTAGM